MTTAKTQFCKTWVRVASVAFAMLAAFSAQADTFMFNKGWSSPEHQYSPFTWSSFPTWWWNLDTGAQATRVPGDPADIVCLTNNPYYKQVLKIGDSSTAAAIEIAELVGYPDRSLWFPARDKKALLNHTFTVSNPDGFDGFFDAGDSGAEIVLKATASRSPDLSHVIASNRVYLTVADAGTAASVRSVQGGGAIDKKGDGDLTVHSAGGAETKIYVKGGSLAIDGVTGTVDSPTPGALYHFDASRIDTMTYTVDGSRTNVTRWASLGGTGMYAYRPPRLGGTGKTQIKYANAPFISAVASPTGLPLVDFGSATEAGIAEYGPTNCIFGLSYVGTVGNDVEEIGSEKVREVFYAGCRSQLSESALFGGYNEHDWMPGTPEKYRYNWGSAARSVICGEHWLNGKATETSINTDYFPERSQLLFHVYGCAATNDTIVRYLATDGLGPTKTGGWRVGEILMYTNVLTRAERARVNRYLVKKWIGSDDCDAGAVMVANGAGSLGVPSGHTAKVRRVAAEGGTLVKSGEGRLEIDHLHPATVSIDVQGGSLAVTSGNSPVSANPQPASGAYLWLDAEHGLTVTNAAGTADFVVKWSDRRGDGYGVYAEIPSDSAYYSGRAPYVVPGAANGHDVVSFVHDNSNSSDCQSWMRIVPSGENGREAFVALRFANRGTTPSVFGSTSSLIQCEYRHLLNTSSAGPLVAAGLWTADGVPCDPWTYAIPGTEAYHVYSVSLSEKHAFDLLAKSTIWGTTGVGMLEIGEYIVYDRKLNDAERRDTVAYLMEKWTGAKSPEAEGRLHVGTLSFADGVDPVLESDDNATVERLAGADGRTFVKRGAGAATVRAARGGAQISSISVEEGSLVFDPTPDPSADALFHFDASDLSSLSYYVTDGGTRTNVTTWADRRANGIVSTSYISPANSSDAISFTNATLKTVETTAGVVRTVVDFGRRNSNNSTTKYTDAAGMKISGVADKTVRELHVVWADAHAAESGRYADMATSSGKALDYYRYGTKLIRADWCEAVANGLLMADGDTITADFQPGTAAHLISAVPTGPTTVTSMFLDRTSNAGGGWYGELVAFSNALTVTERDFLMKRLRAKWFGTAEPVWTNATPFASVSVASGASLDFTKNAFVRAASVSGGGSISAAGLAVSGSLSVRYGGADDVERIDVDGDVVFDEGATITVTADSANVVEQGEWTILSAYSVSGSMPTLNAVNFGRKFVRLRRVDNRLDIVVTRPGMSIIIR